LRDTVRPPQFPIDRGIALPIRDAAGDAAAGPAWTGRAPLSPGPGGAARMGWEDRARPPGCAALALALQQAGLCVLRLILRQGLGAGGALARRPPTPAHCNSDLQKPALALARPGLAGERPLFGVGLFPWAARSCSTLFGCLHPPERPGWVVCDQRPARFWRLLRIDRPARNRPLRTLAGAGPLRRQDPAGSPCISPREARGLPDVAASETFDALITAPPGGFAQPRPYYATAQSACPPAAGSWPAVVPAATEAQDKAQASPAPTSLWFSP